jgi:hypothetical protein
MKARVESIRTFEDFLHDVVHASERQRVIVVFGSGDKTEYGKVQRSLPSLPVRNIKFVYIEEVNLNLGLPLPCTAVFRDFGIRRHVSGLPTSESMRELPNLKH